jgi:hypothetical protein
LLTVTGLIAKARATSLQVNPNLRTAMDNGDVPSIFLF